MNLKIDTSVADHYKSLPQKARFRTEEWTHLNVLCPNCGKGLEKYPNNRPVADFQCRTCREDFELKASSSKIRKSIPDGAYSTMMARLSSNTNPNLFLLEYDSTHWLVRNLMVIPKYYFSPGIIQKRTPLSPTARRAGWLGCNILVGNIPAAGRIPLVVDQAALPLERILTAWSKTSFLKDVPDGATKSWLLETMSCIDNLHKQRFDLSDVYKFEPLLRAKFPHNRFIKEKLRQQLQVLRAKGYLTFLGEGRYEVKSIFAPQALASGGSL